jgi:ribosomal protein S18 acetylase RimI-like enzyme
MIIRNSDAPDLPDLVAIYNAARAPIECFQAAQVTVEEFQTLTEGEEIQVATDNEEVIGFVSVWSPENFIHHLYVSPDRQHKGIGKALIRACVSRYGLPLKLKSVIANTGACAFYEHNHWLVKETGVGPDGPYHYYCLNNS